MTVPQAKVTMLGTKGSGKTTYLLGMYAVLSAGVQGHTLVTTDLDDDEDMADAWYELCDNGRVPPATSTEPKLYSFIFRQDGETILTFDWEDYRGGAMDGNQPEATDAGRLQARLIESDSIYLVLNGTHLAGSPVVDERRDGVKRMTLARRMNAYLANTLSERAQRGVQLPSITVLLTKADMIRQASPRTPPEELMDQLCDLVQRLLPAAFEQRAGSRTLVCPVQLGAFGQDMAGEDLTLDTSKVNPRNLAYPLIHSFLNLLDTNVRSDRFAAGRLQNRITESADDLEKYRKTFRSIFQPKYVASQTRAIQDEREQLEKMQETVARMDTQVARLVGRLEEARIMNRVAVFEDGKRVV
ncbi:hypothetical protein GCM10009839_44930 [Catenulispora yoronensis]|uniref:Uncharacterized protein n=1 Tax=Catenulispora yoronensis TaxID=450799 RepID=A0ABP5G1B9_9ACTN